MLLISEEEKGSTSASAVGGGAAAMKSPKQSNISLSSPVPKSVMPAVPEEAPLPERLLGGDTRESFRVEAGLHRVFRYAIEAGDRIEWDCFVADGLTIDLIVKVACTRGRSGVDVGGRRVRLVGVDRSRVVSERDRRTAFRGRLDLSGEHADCFGGPLCSSDGSALTLTVEFDNSFSYFACKAVDLRLTATKRAPFGLGLLAEKAPEPAPAPRAPQVSLCERADLAAGTGGADDDDTGDEISRLRKALAEATRHCPADATMVQGHLRAAQKALTVYMDVANASSPLG